MKDCLKYFTEYANLCILYEKTHDTTVKTQQKNLIYDLPPHCGTIEDAKDIICKCIKAEDSQNASVAYLIHCR